MRTFQASRSAPRTARPARAKAPTYNAGMQDPIPPLEILPEDDVNVCVRVLRTIEADRSHLARLPGARRELLMLAGLVAKPERHDVSRMAKAFRRAKRAAAKEHDRKVIAQPGLRMQRRAAAMRRCGSSGRSARPRRRARVPAGAQLLRVQAAVRENASLLRLDVRRVRRLQLRQARTDRRPRGPLRARHRRAHQDRFSGVAEAAAGGRARHRHHPLSGRRGRALCAGSRTLRFRAAPADPWS